MPGKKRGVKSEQAVMVVPVESRFKELVDQLGFIRSVVQIADIIGPHWPTDPKTVEDFRATIRAGQPIGTITLRQLPDGKFEILDGFHRVQALVMEGVATYWADVIACSDDEAAELRIRASLRKTQDVLHGRALMALRERFVEMLVRLRAETLYEPAIDDQGREVAVIRREPLPDDPTMALLAVVHHLETRSGERLDWERMVEDWLADTARKFDRDVEWLRTEVLNIGMLAGGVSERSDAPAVAKLLNGIPDLGMRAAVVERLNVERAVFSHYMLARALDFVGVGPHQDSPLPFLPKHTPTQMRQLLVRNTLKNLETRFIELQTAWTKRGSSPAREPGAIQGEVVIIETAEGPGVVDYDDAYRPLHFSIERLVRMMGDYDRAGKSWQHATVQADLRALAEETNKHVKPE